MKTNKLAAALIALIALGACGGNESAPQVATLGAQGDASPSAAPSIDPEKARIEFAECMREHGVEVPDPAAAPGDEGGAVFIGVEGEFDEAKFKEADDACRHLLQGAFEEPSAAQMDEFEDAAVAFAQCMRDNGVEDHPDPEFSGDGMAIEISGSDIMDDPDFKSAEEKCRKLLPGAGEFGAELEVAP
ncbi:MAG TPA: hypothetical protein VNC78_05650 [Actinomycetota bacterium]|nr:hypothetical protein [Actinomycetota bacterium]